jgi:hypothetical protein
VLTSLPDPAPPAVRRTLSLEVSPDGGWSAGLRVTASGRDLLVTGGGAPLRDITGTVRERLAGTRGCTHLNDTLRFLRYVPALTGFLPGATMSDHAEGW